MISRVATGERFIIKRCERPLAALIGTTELERLERTSRAARRLALALGQAEDILEIIERRELHQAMAAYGLWQDEADLTGRTEPVRDRPLRLAPSTASDQTVVSRNGIQI